MSLYAHVLVFFGVACAIGAFVVIVAMLAAELVAWAVPKIMERNR